MRQIRIVALAALAAPLFAGCVADYRLFAEDKFSTAPDASAYCQYRWTAARSQYRVQDGRSYGWADAEQRGQPGLLPYLRELVTDCAGRTPKDSVGASVSAYTVDYFNKEKRDARVVPTALMNMVSIGIMPMELSNNFAVCVEARMPDGQVRRAMARGTLDSVTNIWGAMESPLHRGGTIRHDNKFELLRHVTQQAWNKLWLPGQTLDPKTACKGTLDALSG